MNSIDMTERNTYFSLVPQFIDAEKFDVPTFLGLSSMICEFFALWDARFLLLRTDVEGNMKKVTRAANNLRANTLYDIIVNETVRDDGSGSIGLLWLKRTFEFVVSVLKYFSKSTSQDSMRDLITKAYDDTLTKYHNKIMRHTFRFILRAVPKRSKFIKTLGLERENCEQIVLLEAGKFADYLEPCLIYVNQMLVEHHIEDP